MGQRALTWAKTKGRTTPNTKQVPRQGLGVRQESLLISTARFTKNATISVVVRGVDSALKPFPPLNGRCRFATLDPLGL